MPRWPFLGLLLLLVEFRRLIERCAGTITRSVRSVRPPDCVHVALKTAHLKNRRNARAADSCPGQEGTKVGAGRKKLAYHRDAPRLPVLCSCWFFFFAQRLPPPSTGLFHRTRDRGKKKRRTNRFVSQVAGLQPTAVLSRAKNQDPGSTQCPKKPTDKRLALWMHRRLGGTDGILESDQRRFNDSIFPLSPSGESGDNTSVHSAAAGVNQAASSIEVAHGSAASLCRQSAPTFLRGAFLSLALPVHPSCLTFPACNSGGRSALGERP